MTNQKWIKELEQEELDALERPVSQARLESDEWEQYREENKEEIAELEDMQDWTWDGSEEG